MMYSKEKNKAQLTVLIRIMKTMGNWPLDLTEGRWTWTWMTCAIFSVTSLISMILFQIRFLINIFGDIIEMTDVLCTLLTIILTSFKMITIIRYKKLFSCLLNEILNNELIADIPVMNYGTETVSKRGNKLQKMATEILDSTWRQFHVITYTYQTLVFITAYSYSTVPLGIMGYQKYKDGNITRIMAYKANYEPWFKTYETPTYQILYLYEGWAGYITFGAVSGADGLFCLLTIYCCSQLKLLQYLYESLSHDDIELERRNSSIDTAKYKAMTHYIAFHNKVLRFCDDLEHVFGPICLAQFFTSCLIICLIAFQSSLEVQNFGRIANKIPYLGAAITQLFVFNYFGQNIINESSALTDKVYGIDWFDRSAKFKRSLEIIIRKTQQPMKLTAFKFAVLSLESFTSILSSAMSYFTLLQTLTAPEEN